MNDFANLVTNEALGLPIELLHPSSSTVVVFCQKCEKQVAEIFQVTGDFCLQCWQDLTHPDVEVQEFKSFLPMDDLLAYTERSHDNNKKVREDEKKEDLVSCPSV